MASTPSAVHEAPPTGLLGWARRHPLGAFYAVTFLVSWGYWVPDAISGGHRSHTPGLLGPMVAAFVVTGLVEGAAGLRDLLARMGRWRVPPRWYLAAAAPLALALGVAAVVSLGPGRFPTLTDWVRMEGFPAAGVVGSFALILVVNAYGEETGWRGFALPRFRRRHDRFQASLLVAVPWMLWHLPTFFLDTGYRGFNPVLVPGFALGIFAGAVVLTWLYEGACSSILVVALWHAFLNLGSATPAGQGAVQVAVTMLVIVWSLVIARSWRRGRPTPR
jgi:membrane protease YdiL (CAAX protease family)